MKHNLKNERIVEYKIFGYGNVELFNDFIGEKLKEGWQPYGTIIKEENYMYQPMVKYEKSN